MSRAALRNKTNIIIGVVIAILVVGVGLGLIEHHHNKPIPKPTTYKVAALTQINYQGVQGETALATLQHHHRVLTKSYSFGELVTSIDGVAGNSPKYWTFYVNGHQASVGAGSYQSKSTDHIEWKLQ